MIRAFRYPLYPTATQEATLVRWLGLCAVLYNAALQERRDAWKRQRVSVTRIDQQKSLTQIRADDPEYAAMPVGVARSALTRLDRAFKAFFRRCKAGGTPGYPRFRARARYDSFSLPVQHGTRIVGDRLHIHGLGDVKLRLYRPLRGTSREVRVQRKAGRWWVSVVCDLGEAPTKVSVRSAVGIDLGLTAFATLSDGSEVANPRHFRMAQDALARRQRAAERCCRGSRNRARARLLVARTHEHVANQRLDFARKLVVALFARHDLVSYEDLDVAGFMDAEREGGSTGLRKSIHDAGWSTFIGALIAKAESAGRWAVAVDPRGTSQRCSNCGAVVPKALWERRHACPCGFTAGRDHNAALNVLALAMSAAPGRGVTKAEGVT